MSAHAPARPSGARPGGGGAGALPRAASAGRAAAAFDTPRGFGDEPLTVDQELAIELESVKRERQQLLESIAQVKAEAGTAGGEAQQADIRQLLKELELKKAKLNELKGDSRKAGAAIARVRDADADAQRLTPDGCSLRDEMARVEEDLQEAEAKNRLYQLLHERTRREHLTIDQKARAPARCCWLLRARGLSRAAAPGAALRPPGRARVTRPPRARAVPQVRDKQDSRRACLEDLGNLSAHLNATRGAREAAEKELAKTKRQASARPRGESGSGGAAAGGRRAVLSNNNARARAPQVEEARSDWTRKIRERRAEVRELKRRQQKEREREVKARERALDKEKAERAAAARLKMEQEAYQLQVAALAPKIEALEASWNRLRAISGADTPGEVVEYWQGLKSKEARMRELVALAERREAACKAEIGRLLAARSAMFESSRAAAAAAAAATAPAADAARERDGAPEPGDEGGEAAAARIEAAERRMDAAQVQFGKLRSICVAAEQGMRSLLQRLAVALEEVPPPAAASPPLSGGHASPGGAGGAAARPAPAAAEAMRRHSNGGGAPGSGRGSAHGARDGGGPDAALASKANRLNAGRARDAARAEHALGGGGASALSLAHEGSAGPGPVAGGLPLPGLPLALPSPAPPSGRPALPSRGRDTIDDDSFFDALPALLSEVTARLERLLAAGDLPDMAAIRAAAAAAGARAPPAAGAGGSADGTAAPSPRGGGPAGGAGAGAAELGGAPPREAGASEAEPAVAAGADERDSEGGAQPEAEPGAPAAEEAAEEHEGGEVGAEEAGAAAPQEGDAGAAGGGGEASAAAGEAPAEGDAAPAPLDAPVSGGSRPASGTGAAASEGAAAETPAAPAVPALALGSFGVVTIPESERALIKGLQRRTWTGAPWLDAVGAPPPLLGPGAAAPSGAAGARQRKGRAREAAAAGPDLSRILGFTPPGDVPAESDSDGSADADEPPGGVPDREWLKARAAKATARAAAKAAAAAAAAQAAPRGEARARGERGGAV
ncbi:hypothetical protein HT031_003799 [Scenedesmus sp. PABB004]|nr:hypothetical protein HT031_003799 [Scenedesmus sp. PABB004]